MARVSTPLAALALAVLLPAAVAQPSSCGPPGQSRKVVVTEFDLTNPKIEVQTSDIVFAAPGEVLIHVRARPIHPADSFSVKGVYPGFRPESLPAVPGLEGMGVVAQLGKGTKELCPDIKVGMRVVPDWLDPATPRSWQDYVAVNCSNVVKIPGPVSDLSASQLLVNPMTVMGMLETLVPVDPEDKSSVYILQSAGGSALGRMLIQLARHLGYKTISTVRRCEQAEELKKIGADHVICTATDKVVDSVFNITSGMGAWGAVDAVAGEMTGLLQDSVKANGKVLAYGALEGLAYKGSVVSSLFRAVNVEGFWLQLWWLSLSHAQRKERMEGVLAFMAAGVLSTHNGRVFNLDDAKSAIADEARQGRSSDGKTFMITAAKCLMQGIKEEL
uniref:Enoyl reductase (ER) domain-containing protein n=1 Tax=Hemiselmis tepida TaxID=464990 RepID=A0A7S0V2J5_9CRYP|mmetsp:Transcript_11715/g.30344  ORF Transcript_11715/g.30344 Transcript_11715/m.30344 type:complete len:388 (+) Transcript_11715:59-1222(+)|eukprot:CAMPEP_0174919626 /NCGR_PEP_ID=MMETSP1355-20121228/3775_1 /TAXON_ID=464990 /ORGANISM="Hemiselmis tepida, Strain CCMP443" /LENGTH=387 /DNA_ID=CAMNT_0016164863 /DNA_START=38 /DNA_END=1201 /DNA_ORIENTATION=-